MEAVNLTPIWVSSLSARNVDEQQKNNLGIRRVLRIGSLLLLGLAATLLSPVAEAGQSVTLAWNPNIETNLLGYRLYFGTTSRHYTSSNNVSATATSSTASNLTPGLTYYFAVTALAP